MGTIDYVGQIWEAAKLAGPFGTALMFYVWRRSDNERREIQGKYNELSVNTLSSLAGVQSALRDVNLLLTGRKP